MIEGGIKMSRRPEKIISILGVLLVLIFLGGFSLTIINITFDQYQEIIAPIFQDITGNMPASEGFQTVKTLGAWFALTAFVTLILVAIGNLAVDKYPKRAAILYAASGIAILLGSQRVAYPLAFIFFVVTAMSLLRKESIED